MAHYLALYSALNKIPLPRNLASTATIKGKKVGGIGGLKNKLQGSIKKGIDVFILCETNKRDERHKERSFEHIPADIQNKIKQVHFISWVEQIKIALDETLKNLDEKIIHSCGKSEVQSKQEPKDMEFQATPEQLLAFMFDHGFCGVSRNKENKQGNAIPPASSETGPLQNILSIEFGKKGVFEKIRNLYYEYKQKLNSNSDIDEWYKNELAKLENQNDNEESQEKINEIQEEIKRIKQEAVTKREIAEQSRNNEQKITDIEKEIEEYKQAKVNEEVILENINRKIEENRQNPNQQNPDPNLEADRQTVNQRIAELNGKIVSREAEVANLRKNQSWQELIKEVEELEAQIRHLEEELQNLLKERKLSNYPSNSQLESKKRELEQEYQRKKTESSQGTEQLFLEYENKFKEVAAPLASLIPDISRQLADLGYKKLIIQWKSGKQFARIHLTTTELSVNLEAIKN